MIWNWVQDLVRKFSFIHKVEKSKNHVYIHYKNLEGKIVYKRLPFRANKEKLLKTLDEIKTEIRYDENKPVNEYTLAGFAFSNTPDDAGEDNRKTRNDLNCRTVQRVYRFCWLDCYYF